MSRDIIKLDQIDVIFSSEEETITAVKGCDYSHPRRGISTESLDILEQGNQPLYG